MGQIGVNWITCKCGYMNHPGDGGRKCFSCHQPLSKPEGGENVKLKKEPYRRVSDSRTVRLPVQVATA